VQYAKDVQQKLTFIAPFVAIALREMPVKNVQRQHKITSRRLCQSPAIPIILSNDPNEWSKKKKDLHDSSQQKGENSMFILRDLACKSASFYKYIAPEA
jgi:hypothetical protein